MENNNFKCVIGGRVVEGAGAIVGAVELVAVVDIVTDSMYLNRKDD